MTGSYVGGSDSAGCSTSITEKQRERHRSSFWTVRRRVPGRHRKHLNPARDQISLLEDARPVLILMPLLVGLMKRAWYVCVLFWLSALPTGASSRNSRLADTTWRNDAKHFPLISPLRTRHYPSVQLLAAKRPSGILQQLEWPGAPLGRG